MNDPNSILEGEGEKMRHIKIHRETKINGDAIGDFVKQALKLNQ
jgi:hypothetical protein